MVFICYAILRQENQMAILMIYNFTVAILMIINFTMAFLTIWMRLDFRPKRYLTKMNFQYKRDLM